MDNNTQPNTPQQPPAPEPQSVPVYTPQPQQPAPAPQPQQFPVPSAPVGSTNSGTPVSGPSQKKRLTLIAIIVGALAVLGLIGFTVYALAFSVSKEDYAEASKVYNNVTEKGSASIRSLSTFSYLSSSSTDTKISNDIEDAKKDLEAYKTENAKFEGLKALRDGDVKQKYEAYSAKYAAYTLYAEDFLASIDKVYSAYKICNDSDSTSSTSNLGAYRVAVGQCITALDDAKDVRDADLKEYVKAITESFKTLDGVLAEYIALATPNQYGTDDYTRARELRTSLYDINTRDASTDYSSNATKHAKEVSPSTAANELGDILREKQTN